MSELKDNLVAYVKADLEIKALEEKKAGIIKDINDNHIDAISQETNNVIEVEEQAYTLNVVIDRESKKKQESPQLVHKFTIHTAEIHK